ncbi:transposase family protein [Polymorphospora sp. NPDC051019]|uniref:transposase family protein n=1 Tax=Polymorphospora sp. NPDC051019 TaxID=3155725 RepID=UPI00341C3F08
MTAAVCAVVAGYRSYTAIAKWVADVPASTALALGITPDRRPSEATICRLLQALDPQRLTATIGVWLSGRSTADTSTGRRTIAVDSKTLRGSRTTDTAARHVMAACDQATGVVLASTEDQRDHPIPAATRSDRRPARHRRHRRRPALPTRPRHLRGNRAEDRRKATRSR